MCHFCLPDVSDLIPFISVLEQTIEILNQNSTDSEDYEDPAVLAETVQKGGGIASSAVAHLISNATNFSEEVRQEIIEDVQDLTSTELTGAWTGEEITGSPSIRDTDWVYCKQCFGYPCVWTGVWTGVLALAVSFVWAGVERFLCLDTNGLTGFERNSGSAPHRQRVGAADS